MHSITTISKLADITFYPSGRIDISSRVAKLININDGDVIDIMTDGVEFYLCVMLRKDQINGRYMGVCHSSKKNYRNLRTYSKRICNYMYKFAGDRSQPLRLSAGEVVEHPSLGKIVAIITRITLNK